MLTDEETGFLSTIGYTEADVLDARGMSKPSAIALAKKNSKALYLGNGCTKGGHRLKYRSGGHCAQCLPMRQTFQERQEKPGWVYICASPSLGLLKVGSSSDINTRARKLNFERYGGADDWVLIFSCELAQTGRVESAAHSLLNAYVDRRQYERDGHAQTAYECFKCSPVVALNAIVASLGDQRPKDFWRLATFAWGRSTAAG